MLLLLFLLIYVHLVIMNKVDLIFTMATISVRCPDGQISIIGEVFTTNKSDNLRSYCSQPYLLPSDDSINLFRINALLFKCTDEKRLEMTCKLHLTNIRQSLNMKPSSIAVYTKNPPLKEKFDKESFSKNYTVKFAEKVKAKNLYEEKEHHTFYLWFTDRDWIICRLDIDYLYHPCFHINTLPGYNFRAFCYYNILAAAPMSIEEVNEEYNRALNENMNMNSDTIPQITINKTSVNKKANISKSEKNVKPNQSKKRTNNSSKSLTKTQANSKKSIVIVLCILISIIILTAIFYFYKSKKSVEEENDSDIEPEKSSIDSVVSTINDEIPENPIEKKEQKTPMTVRSYHLDDIE